MVRTSTLSTERTTSSLVNEKVQELMRLVRDRHPDARFVGPMPGPEEGLWIIDAYFGNGEDDELCEELGRRETDILLNDGLWLSVLCLPASEYYDADR